MSQKLEKVDWKKLNPELQEKLKKVQAKFATYDEIVKKIEDKDTRTKIYQCQKMYLNLKDLANTLNKKQSSAFIREEEIKALEKEIEKTYQSLVDETKKIEELCDQFIFLNEENQHYFWQDVKEQEENVLALMEHVKKMTQDQLAILSPIPPQEVLKNLQDIEIVIKNCQKEIDKKYLSVENSEKFKQSVLQINKYKTIMKITTSINEDIKQYQLFLKQIEEGLKRTSKEDKKQQFQLLKQKVEDTLNLAQAIKGKKEGINYAQYSKDRLYVWSKIPEMEKEIKKMEEEKNQLTAKEQRKALKWLKQEMKTTQTRIDALNQFLAEKPNPLHRLKATEGLKIEQESLKVLTQYQEEVTKGYEKEETINLYKSLASKSDETDLWLEIITTIDKDIEAYEATLEKIKEHLENEESAPKEELEALKDKIAISLAWAKNIRENKDDHYEKYQEIKQEVFAKSEEVFSTSKKGLMEKVLDKFKLSEENDQSKKKNQRLADFYSYEYYQKTKTISQKETKEVTCGEMCSFAKVTKKINGKFQKLFKKEHVEETLSEDQKQSASKINEINGSIMNCFQTDEKGYITSDSYLEFLKSQYSEREKNKKCQQRINELENSVRNVKVYHQNLNEETLNRMNKNYTKTKWLRKGGIALALAATLSVGAIGAHFGWLPKQNRKNKASIEASYTPTPVPTATPIPTPTIPPVPTATPSPTITPTPNNSLISVVTPNEETEKEQTGMLILNEEGQILAEENNDERKVASQKPDEFEITVSENLAYPDANGYVEETYETTQPEKMEVLPLEQQSSNMDAPIPESVYQNLETYKEKLEELKQELPQSETQYQAKYEIGGYCVANADAQIAPDYISAVKKENLAPSYYGNQIPRIIQSIVMVSSTNPNEIINVTTQEEAAALEDMGYIAQAVSVINQYSTSPSNIEGRFNVEDIVTLTLHK